MAQILVVDDESDVLGSIKRVLEHGGFEVITASSGQEALELLEHQRPDLIILDVIMPEISGFEVCQRIRGNPYLSKLPIVFLTVKNRPNDVTYGLDVGGDDYITKPFDGRILPARVRALLRRSPGGVLDTTSDFLAVGELRLHITRPEVHIGEQTIQLTTVEHYLLHYLMMHPSRPVSVDELLQNVWEYPAGTGDPTLVYVHIKKLRAKLEFNTDTHYIRSVYGRGYVVDS